MKFDESGVFWNRMLGACPWPGVHLFQALAEKFLSGVDIVNPLGFAAVFDRPVLYLANHQVYLESLLFNVGLAHLQGRPVVALAKADHRERWLGRFIELVLSYPGLDAPPAVEYFDRENSDDIVRAVSRLEDLANHQGQSVLVHVEGTRRRSARRGRVQALSPLWPELAVRNRWPVVPVRFVGGLPVEDQGYKLDAPVGFGSQTIRVGAPISAAELAPLSDDRRVSLVRSALNALSDNHTEEPEPPDPVFAAAVQDWVNRTGVEPMAATALAALVRHHRAKRAQARPGGPVLDAACDALVEAAETGLREAVRRPPAACDADWLERLGNFLFGTAEVVSAAAGGARQAG